jgi:glycosyltransferase involved in cell wall biosynthesis
MLVTVVIPTHRRPQSLERALLSVAAQSLPRDRFEVVVVASPDDPGAEVVARVASATGLSARCEAIPGDPWDGTNPSAKRNHGGRRARGEWLAFLDDDCEAEPDWLAEAAKLFPGAVAVEGRKVIPPPPVPTLTYRGLLSFERPGGYQSCNMFYRRDVFLEVGGFDTRFPFYLEDSDLAWTVLDRGHGIPHADRAVVRHPVPPPAPWRLLDDARRASLLALLRAKHPGQFRRAGVRVLNRNHLAYLAAWALVVAASIAFGWAGLAAGLAALGLLTLADSYRRFRGCRVTAHEVAVTTLLLPVVPVVRAVQYARGLWRHRRPGPVLPLTPAGTDG